MSHRTTEPQDLVLRNLIRDYEQALTARNYPKADALHFAIQRAVKLRPPIESGRDEQPAGPAS